MKDQSDERTFGQLAVGVDFNPSGLLSVAVIKQNYADIIDDLKMTQDESDSPDVKRLCAIAITEAEGAAMWAVKAKTKPTAAGIYYELNKEKTDASK